jgi:hypothetical protein
MRAVGRTPDKFSQESVQNPENVIEVVDDVLWCVDLEDTTTYISEVEYGRQDCRQNCATPGDNICKYMCCQRAKRPIALVFSPIKRKVEWEVSFTPNKTSPSVSYHCDHSLLTR